MPRLLLELPGGDDNHSNSDEDLSNEDGSVAEDGNMNSEDLAAELSAIEPVASEDLNQATNTIPVLLSSLSVSLS